MSLAVVRKTTQDTAVLFVLLTGAVILFEVLVVCAVGEMTGEFATVWLQKPIFKGLLRTLLGSDIVGNITPTVLVTIGFGHPVLYALTWAFLLAVCTRVTVGELDWGTADLLLTLPVSRTKVYTSVSVVWLVAGVPISAAPLAGVWIGEMLAPLPIVAVADAVFEVFADVIDQIDAIGGLTMGGDPFARRRGHAIAVVLGVLIASLFLNFLAQYWSAVDRIAFMSLLHYYRPLPVVRAETLPTADIGVLAGVALLAWLIGLWYFRQRDIPAV